MRICRSVALFSTIFVAWSALAQTPKPARPPDPERGRQFLGLGPAPDPAAAARGQTVFEGNCGFCHGKDAKGAEGPDLLRSSTVLHDEHGEGIGSVVKKGRVDRGMPAFPNLTDQQIADLAQFLHARVEAAANRFGYHILNIVTGNGAAGQQFFAAHCSGCHRPEGDLAHIGKRFTPEDLQAQFLYPTGGPPPTVRVRKRDGTAYAGTLQSLDDFTVVIQSASGEPQRFDRNAVSIDIQDPLEGHRKLLDVYTNADMHNVLAYLESVP